MKGVVEGDRSRIGVALGLSLALVLSACGGPASEQDTAETREHAEQLWAHRNLGKALYENPATHEQAVDELRTALELAPESVRDRINLGLALLRAGKEAEGIAKLELAQQQDPALPHTWFNLGIAYKHASRYDDAIAQLSGMLERVTPNGRADRKALAITHYNLGVLYKLREDPEQAIEHLERAAQLAPDLAGPHFQLASSYRQAGRAADSSREMTLFREAKAAAGDAGGEEDLEWSYYSELYEPIDPLPRPAPASAPVFQATTVARGADPATAGLVVLAASAVPEVAGAPAPPGEALAQPALAQPAVQARAEPEPLPAPDLLVYSSAGVELLRGGGSAGTPDTEGNDRGLGGLRNVRHVAAGDFDDDGLEDLAVVFDAGAPAGVAVLWNRGGSFVSLPAGLPAAAGRRYDRAVWLDVDHDYDPDLLLLGPEPALLRNDGDGSFTDRTTRFPFVRERHVAAAARLDLVADDQGFDLAVFYRDGAATLYRDHLGGRYQARELAVPSGVTEALAADIDHDGWTDLVVAGNGVVALLRNDRHEGFERQSLAAAAGDVPLALLDVERHGAADLLAGAALLRDRGEARFEAAGGLTALAAAPAALAAADFDGDGSTDVAAVRADGAVVLLHNATPTANGFLRIALLGTKNPKLADGAEIEVKAGALYQKALYRGVPLVFGLGGHAAAEAVRITWPNGLIQNEIRVPAGSAERYQEAQRLSGSCPMIFSWNGSQFVFNTDVLGVAPLGASSGDGEYFPVDHDEVIQIPGENLTDRDDGSYAIHITEELHEVAFLDQIRLEAVDHPEDVEIATNVKFQGPPFPDLRVYGTREKHHPTAAVDDRGDDVLPALVARDGAYPHGFERLPNGLATLHHLELAFDAVAFEEAEREGRDLLLVLNGWVDWADGSTFLAASQENGPGLVLPYLEAQDRDGRWTTVIEDMGLPAGKPKTIVADLTGRLPVGTRRLRITTSACVYWDEIYVANALEPLPVTLTELPTAGARLHFRGFSRPVVDPQRLQPERFVYADRRPLSMWNQTPGRYTRYGDVGELLRAVDDLMVIMGSGDEVQLSFDASALPELPAGWRRDFLLTVDGWAKDADANTAYSQSVEPLPYHGMPQYPYFAPDHYPDDAAHRLYRERYLTRAALRPLQPLRPMEPHETSRSRRGRSPEKGTDEVTLHP